MALSSGNKAAWADISTLFTNLNTQRKRISSSYTNLTIPNNQNTKMLPNVVDTLKAGISELSLNSFVGNVANVSSITTPKQGEKIYVTPFTQIQSKITDLSNVFICTSHRSANFIFDYVNDFSDFIPNYEDDFSDFTSNRKSNFSAHNRFDYIAHDRFDFSSQRSTAFTSCWGCDSCDVACDSCDFCLDTREDI